MFFYSPTFFQILAYCEQQATVVHDAISYLISMD